MSWSMLSNGYCPTETLFQFEKVASGQVNQAAIDNMGSASGRLFTWGDATNSYTGQTPTASGANFLAHSAVDIVGGQARMLHPYQVGTKDDWKDVQASEYTYMAIDSLGAIYAWGDGNQGQGGWAATAKYKWDAGADERWEPYPGSGSGYSVALVPTLVDSGPWTDFALGWYHAVAIAPNGNLWVWGTNYDNTYGSASYADGYKSLVPVRMTWAPLAVKLVSASFSTTAIVTTNNQVWRWGDFGTGNIAVPTQVPLTLPAGVTIVGLSCDWEGVLVLLSNGDCYGVGEFMCCAPGNTYTSSIFLVIPGGHIFKKVQVDNGTSVGLDTSGQLWGWGLSGGNKISRNAAYYDQQSLTVPVFIASENVGGKVWKDFDIGGSTHVLIGNDGQLYAYGSNAFGQLGIDDLTVLTSGAARLCDPVKDAVGDDATVDLFEPVVVPGPTYLDISAQSAAHDPCGHWHRSESGVAYVDVPYICCRCSVDIDGTTIAVVCAGVYYPNLISVWQYNLSTNEWALQHSSTLKIASALPGGASIRDGIIAYHNSKYDVSGTPLSESYSNPMMATWVIKDKALNYKEWPGTKLDPGAGKVAVGTSGVVAVMVRDGSNVRVEVSTDYGVTYVTRYNIPYDGDIRDWAILIDTDDTIHIAWLDNEDDFFYVRRSDDDGVSWIDSTAQDTIANAERIYFDHSGPEAAYYLGIISDDNSKIALSITNGVDWDEKDPPPGIHTIMFMGDGFKMYVVDDGVDHYADDFRGGDDSYNEFDSYKTILTDSSVRNFGQNGVYSGLEVKATQEGVTYMGILVTTDLGRHWTLASSPVRYTRAKSVVLDQGDNPVWDFTPQSAKF